MEILRDGNDIAILAVGNMVNESLKAAKILEESTFLHVVNSRFVKPLDKNARFPLLKIQ